MNSTCVGIEVGRRCSRVVPLCGTTLGPENGKANRMGGSSRRDAFTGSGDISSLCEASAAPAYAATSIEFSTPDLEPLPGLRATRRRPSGSFPRSRPRHVLANVVTCPPCAPHPQDVLTNVATEARASPWHHLRWLDLPEDRGFLTVSKSLIQRGQDLPLVPLRPVNPPSGRKVRAGSRGRCLDGDGGWRRLRCPGGNRR
jgi:hypothetical protein